MSNNSSISDYIKGLYKYPVLTRDQEKELWQRMQNGDWRAEEKLIAHNLRFAILILKKTPQWLVASIPREDLIQYANMGLMTAARKWVPQGNIKFASFAKPFIRRYVTRGVENSQHLIRVPVRMAEKIRKLLYTERTLMQKFNRSPTREEIAQEMGVKPTIVDQLKGIVLREPSSLDALISNSNNIDEETN